MKMHQTLLWIFGCMLLHSMSYGQSVVRVDVSADTVGIGTLVEVTYTIENGKGKFVPPDMSRLPLVSGPNSSSSMVYQNGVMSSTQSYSYTLMPQEEGILVIPKATYTEAGKTTDILAKEIVVNRYGAQIKSKRIPTDNTPTPPAREKKKF